MDEQILKDMATDIGETKGMVSAMFDQMEKFDDKIERHDTRLRRVENFFLPAIAVLSLFASKILEVFGLSE